MKKIILAVMLLTTLFVFSGCDRTEKFPTISNPEGNYLTATEGEFTYNLSNQRIYEKLKSQFGLSMLIDLIDKDLLKTTMNGTTSFWDSITEVNINDAINDDIFPNETDGLTEEEIQEKKDDYYDQLYVNYGLQSEADIKEFYHLSLAKEEYARSKIAAIYSAEDFKDTDYQNYFKNNYKNGYYAIIVSFPSIRLYQIALNQLGYQINASGEWVKLSDSSLLTSTEIAKAFVDLYNMNNSYKSDTLIINEGVEYSYTNGTITFNLEKSNEDLHYTNKEITAYQAELDGLLEGMSTYPEGENWYTKKAQVYKEGSRITFVLKFGEEIFSFENVKGEIKTALMDAKLTTSYIQTEMAKLRKEHKIVIFDNDLEKKYVNNIKSLNVEYKATKKNHDINVAQIDTKAFTADDLFKEMNKSYGMSVAASELEYIRFLVNTNLNKVIDYNKDVKKIDDKVLNATKWTVIKQEVADEKDAFENDAYKDYGYPKSYGWENFIKDVYGVKNEEELIYYYVYQDVRETYTQSLGDLSGKSETDDLWKFYEAKMTEMKNNYFNVTGVHLLISVNDEKGTPIAPADWTAKQIENAEEMYQEIMVYLKSDTTTSYVEKLQNLESAFNKAPRFIAGTSTKEQQPVLENVSYTYKGIEVSKYKTAGLNLKYENLGTFTNGTMAEEFNNAVKTIWDANHTSETPTVYGLEPSLEGNYSYIKTKFGYHVYVNLKSFEIKEWEAGKVTPTLNKITLYLANPSDKKLSADLKAAITTYFEPIKQDLTGTNNFYVTEYTDFKGLGLTFSNPEFTKENFIKYLDLRIENLSANLKYK